MEPLRRRRKRRSGAIPGVEGAMVVAHSREEGGLERPQPRAAPPRPLTPPPAAPSSRHAGRQTRWHSRWRQGRGPRRRRHRRSGERQGRRRQVDDRGQLALGLKANGLRVGILDADIYGPSTAASAQPQGKAAGGERPDPPPARRLRRQGDVDRPPGRGGDADDLARADGHLGAHPDAARSRMGRTRHPRRRHAARAPATRNSPWRNRCRSPAR